MPTLLSTPSQRPLNRSVVFLEVMLAALVLAGAGRTAFAQENEVVRIDVTLNEYSFSPNPLRIPSGREVTLVIRNTGRVGHEFMAGRDPEGTDFGRDLFADLHVNIEQADSVESGHAGHSEHAEHSDHAAHSEHHAEDNDEVSPAHAADTDAAIRDTPEEDHGHAEHAHAPEAGHDEPGAEDHHAANEGHAHGTMVEAQAGETFLMTFTLPEDRRGEWTTGCFLPGHYEAGMHGTLIVE